MHDDESARLLIAVRQALEKEIKDREGAELEMEHLTHGWVAIFDQEKKDREHDDADLNNQIATLRHELGNEKEEHASDLALCKRGLGALQAQLTQHFKDLRHAIELEASERITANEQVDVAYTDLRVSIEMNRDAQNAATKDLERAITKNQQAIEEKIRDRTALFEEHAQNLTELRQAMSNIRTEVAGEKEEHVNDVSDLRNVIQNYNQKVTNQFKDFKFGLEYESGERMKS